MRMEKVREAYNGALNLIAKYNRDPGGVSYDHEHVATMDKIRAALAEVEEWEARREDDALLIVHQSTEIQKLMAERDRYAAALRESNTGHYRPVKP